MVPTRASGTFALLAGALAVAALAAGCTTVRESFPGHDAPEVWTALVAAAETPDYGGGTPDQRWFVRENHVRADAAASRIEIYRTLDRVLQMGTVKPQREERVWRFSIALEHGDHDEPPVAVFTSRGVAIPMQAEIEGERYFADVRTLLAAEPAIAPEAEAPRPEETEPPKHPQTEGEPIIDIEKLEPGK
jgi:hypothetical protein